MRQLLLAACVSAGLDHHNRNTLDDRISNLREATRSQNMGNTKRHKDNMSGFKGVTWHSGARKWRAKIRFKEDHIHLGFFNNRQDAHAAYCKAAEQYFGEFSHGG